ncbi:lysophospholipase [Pendulispora rubella]|uniref:Lysophospholipase n=1 Tax=Pendulispora rubella TaxID=2741070 RepID=A0ABZ2LBP0_9BACT
MVRPPFTEEIEIRTADGVSLRATAQEPILRARGTVLLAHAEFASRQSFLRDGRGLAPFLAGQGFRTLAFDFRGHGESPSESEVTYDAFIRHDLAAVAECARARWKGPLVVVGHALGGHVALAARGTGAIDADAIVAIATNVWLRRFEPSLLRWQAKRAAMAYVANMLEARGHFPARALGLGTDDESSSVMRAAVRAAREGTWTSDDGAIDYVRALANVRIPVLAIASKADKLRCVPECAERMLECTAGIKDVQVIANDDRGGAAPGHMSLVTGRRSSHVWEAVAAWLSSRD